MDRHAPQSRVRDPVLFAWALVHALLVLCALWAWIEGPFRGEGVLDGAEVLRLAREGASGTFETKSPLMPALLGLALRVAGDSPWTVGLFGLASSLATLGAVVALARHVDATPRGVRTAAALYALSGSALVYAVQPLPAMFATASLAWGALALARACRGGGLGWAVAGGALCAAAALARAPLSLAGAALLACAFAARPRAALQASATALACGLLAAALWGERAWPGGAWFNLRLGNGGARSGICDVRPGPEYDRLRIEAAFAPVAQRGTPPDFEGFHARALLSEVRADPLGALATLARKAYLFAQRTETVSAADFHHGLARFPVAALLLSSFGVVAPLALCGLARRPRWVLLAPVVAVFAANVLWMTCARYRFPALPFACAAAGVFVASRPGARAWGACAVAALALNVNLSGRALHVPGDGLVQEARLELAGDRAGPRVRELYAAAFAVGSRDARAHYELALALEAEGPARHVEGALEHYALALQLAPDYAEAAENEAALLLREGRVEEARARLDPDRPGLAHAAKLPLNLAVLERGRGNLEGAAALEREGLMTLALRTLAGGDLAGARAWAREASSRGAQDERLSFLLAP